MHTQACARVCLISCISSCLKPINIVSDISVANILLHCILILFMMIFNRECFQVLHSQMY